jgi:magnesium chelatase family protein
MESIMLANVTSAALLGVDAYLVQVEVDAANGLPCFNIVGLPDAAVKESRDRVKTAVLNSGLAFPANKRLTANLAPADMRKEGPSFDLPLALGVLAVLGEFPTEALEGCLFVGELSLDGSLRSVRGALSVALEARKRGVERLLLPEANAAEAAVVEGLRVIPLRDLTQALAWLNGEESVAPAKADLGALFQRHGRYPVDFSDVKGQAPVKRALEVAAAGGHNLLMIGPPGSGKTLLARNLPGILPDLSVDEALEVTKVYSASGLLQAGQSLVAQRPFRSPHHTVSGAGLVGGGSLPRAGEVSLAHLGVLFLDELPEFGRHSLEVLRQPLEDGQVCISRAQASLSFPARCMVAAAMNPCPCGHRGDPRKECSCTPQQIAYYLSRLSGPLMDRLDIQIPVPALAYEELAAPPKAEGSEAVRLRVNAARSRQQARLKAAASGIHCNALMGPREIQAHCAVDPAGQALLKLAVERLGLSARGFDRLLKVARTIADLDEAEKIQSKHLAEAIQYRSLDRSPSEVRQPEQKAAA